MASMLTIDNAKICFRNFSGTASQYNREGDRNFAVIFEDERLVDQLIDDGWNVKVRPPREDGDAPFMYMSVKVKYNNGRGPKVYLVSAGNRVELTEETVSCLDDMEIENIDLDIRPYEYSVNGKSGISAYLHAMEVTQRVDRFAARYNNSEDVPF